MYFIDWRYPRSRSSNALVILPVINKIDLPSADISLCLDDIEHKIGLNPNDVLLVSSKTGEGVRDVLEEVVAKIPEPSGDNNKQLKALIFDSYYDSYRGVVILIRIFDGSVKVGDEILFMANGLKYQVTEVGIRTPNENQTDVLSVGEVGYLCAQIKDIKDVFVGDTVTLANNPCDKPLEGYRKLNPMVYCGLYPVDTKKYEDLKEALEKLSLNDSALEFEAENSQALGFGFRCGFLGLLHMDVVQERLEREYNLDLILTAPSVIYKVNLTDGTTIEIDNPASMPDLTKIKSIEEPYVNASIMTPESYVGDVMKLCQDKRGIYTSMEYFDATRMIIKYEIPLSEIIFNFFDKLKSYTKGYASLDYQFAEYKVSNLTKMDILLNGHIIDALSTIVYKPSAYKRGLAIVQKLKNVIPRQLFEIPVQACINNKAIARADIKALRKDVLSKCYGGDITRKKKLLEKQKEGKKRMKSIGNVDIPQEAFMSILSIDDDENTK